MSKDSSRDTLEEVFLLHRVKLRSIARSIVQKPDLVEDVMQDAYLKVADAAELGTIRRPLCYCAQVVRNVALDCHRRRTVEAAYRTFVDDVEQLGASTMAVADRALDARRVLIMVDGVLSTLAPRTRLAFELNRISGLTQREIAQRLGCSATMVNFMIRDADRALFECRDMFDTDG